MKKLSLKKSLPKTEPLSLNQWPIEGAQRAATFLPMLRRVKDPLQALRSLYVQLSGPQKIAFILTGRAAPLLRKRGKDREGSWESGERNTSRGRGTEELPALS
jgi:hypothetical protein